MYLNFINVSRSNINRSNSTTNKFTILSLFPFNTIDMFHAVFNNNKNLKIHITKTYDLK